MLERVTRRYPGNPDPSVDAVSLSVAAIILALVGEYLGRIYLHKGNVAGADSALRKAVELAPDCATEVDAFRRTAWAALVNPGIDYMKASKPDSAKAVFQVASKVYRGAPHVYSYLGNLAYDAGIGIGAVGFGAVAELTGYQTAFALTSALVFAALGVVWRDRRLAG